MSVIALLGGIIFYFSLAKGGKFREIDLDPHLGQFQGKLLFELFLKHLLQVSRKIKRANRKWFTAKLFGVDHCFYGIHGRATIIQSGINNWHT